MFGTKVYKPEKIMVLVLEDLNEDLVLGSSAAGLLTETVIDLVSTISDALISHQVCLLCSEI